MNKKLTVQRGIQLRRRTVPFQLSEHSVTEEVQGAGEGMEGAASLEVGPPWQDHREVPRVRWSVAWGKGRGKEEGREQDQGWLLKDQISHVKESGLVLRAWELFISSKQSLM